MVGLTEEQIESLKSLKDSNQRALIKMKADLELAMLDLNKVLDTTRSISPRRRN